jgi:hypothetical protein
MIYSRLVWTPCLMHRCVCIWRYILQSYNYKLHFQNLFIYDIPHVSIRTLATENLDVYLACDPWDSNIQMTMGIDQRWQIYPNVVQCLTLTLVDCDRKCHLNRKLTMTQNKWSISPRGGHDDAGYEHTFGDWRKGAWGSKSSPCISWETERQKGQEGHMRWGEFLL